MNTIFTVFKKETSDLLKSPIIALFLLGFLGLSFQLFLSNIFLINQASLNGFFIWLPLLWVVFIPALTFDLWANEYKFKTIDLINALPLPWHTFALGKFLSATFIMTLALLLTTPLVLTFAFLAQIDTGLIFASGLGAWINGVFCVSLGLFFSRFTKNSILSYLATLLSLCALTALSHPMVAQSLPSVFRPWLETVSLDENFKPFLMGSIACKSTLWLLGSSGILLALQSLRICNVASLSKAFITLVLLMLLCTEIPLSWSIDTTANKRHSLSQSTQDTLNALEDSLTIRLYFSSDLPFEIQKIENELLDLLQSFKQKSSQNIFIEFAKLETQTDQERAIQLGLMPLTLHVVEQNSQKTRNIFMGATLHYQDRMSILPNLTQPQSFAYQFTMQVLKLITKDYPKIGILLPEGLSRNDFSSATTLLEQLGDVVLVEKDQIHLTSLNLKSLIIIDPKDLPASFIQEIEELFVNDVPVMIFASPSVVSDSVTVQYKTTGLENFLALHGLQITKEFVLDDVSNAKAQFDLGTSQVELNYPFWLKLSSSELSQTNPATSGLTTLLIPWTHALKIDNTLLNSQDQDILIESSANSFLQEPNQNSISPQYVSQMQNLPMAEKHLLAVSIKFLQSKAKLFVMSSSQFLKNNFLNPNYFVEAQANATFFANLVEYNTWGNQLIGLRSQDQPIAPLPPLSQAQKTNIHLGLMLFALLSPFALWAFSSFWQAKQRKFKAKRAGFKPTQSI